MQAEQEQVAWGQPVGAHRGRGGVAVVLQEQDGRGLAGANRSILACSSSCWACSLACLAQRDLQPCGASEVPASCPAAAPCRQGRAVEGGGSAWLKAG